MSESEELPPIEPLPSESARPVSNEPADDFDAVVAWQRGESEPVCCDICGQPLELGAHYHFMTIVVDSSAHVVGARTPTVMEEEWKLFACAPCFARHQSWLYDSGGTFGGAGALPSDDSELDTLRPPPSAPDDEMAPLETPAPNRS